MERAGIALTRRTCRNDPETFEPACPGSSSPAAPSAADTSNIFIENGRFHGEKIVATIAGRLGSLEANGLPKPEAGVTDRRASDFARALTASMGHLRPRGVRAIRTFISSSSTSDSARDRRQCRSRSACFDRFQIEYCASAFTRSRQPSPEESWRPRAGPSLVSPPAGSSCLSIAGDQR